MSVMVVSTCFYYLSAAFARRVERSSIGKSMRTGEEQLSMFCRPLDTTRSPRSGTVNEFLSLDVTDFGPAPKAPSVLVSRRSAVHDGLPPRPSKPQTKTREPSLLSRFAVPRGTDSLVARSAHSAFPSRLHVPKQLTSWENQCRLRDLRNNQQENLRLACEVVF